MKQEPLLSLRNIGVRYALGRRLWARKHFWALRDVSFDINSGDVVGVIGRNGAGKSTLLRVLADIIRPDRGTLVRQPVRCALLSLRLGFAPQLSGRQNIMLSGLLMGCRRRSMLEALDSIVEFAELGEFIDEPIKTYSNGMLGRLGFAIAAQLEADVLLIDEVMSVGDAPFQKKAAEVIEQRIRQGCAAVIVGHNTGMMRQMCSRLVWIEHGESRMEGDVESVLAAYESFHGLPVGGGRGNSKDERRRHLAMEDE